VRKIAVIRELGGGDGGAETYGSLWIRIAVSGVHWRERGSERNSAVKRIHLLNSITADDSEIHTLRSDVSPIFHLPPSGDKRDVESRR
jgi:hypothetical protein